MFEALIQQTPDGLQAVILGAIAALLPTIAYILKQWREGQFTKEKLAEKGLLLQDAATSQQVATKAAEDMACIVSQLIIANNDGKITQEEYDKLVMLARDKVIANGRALGLDLEEIVNTATVLMQKKAA